MSAPSANTSAQVHQHDGQLARSQDPGYVRAKEQHQAGLSQMLAEPSPGRPRPPYPWPPSGPPGMSQPTTTAG